MKAGKFINWLKHSREDFLYYSFYISSLSYVKCILFDLLLFRVEINKIQLILIMLMHCTLFIYYNVVKEHL